MATNEPLKNAAPSGGVPLPPNPYWLYTDWTAVVRRNYFANLDRLGQWDSATQQILPVAAGSLDDPTKTIYVVVHGWAPGYRSAVDAGDPQQPDLLWWNPAAQVGGVSASAWAWNPVTAPPNGNSSPFEVNPTGMLEAILAHDPNAVALAWSWIDDSATENDSDSILDWLKVTEVYQSEAHTHANGLRLAYALQEVIPFEFWGATNIRLIGHSHGSKVATVAAYTLQQANMVVPKLTILDSPETDSALYSYSANLLGCYLQQMNLADPANPQGGTYVDNYVSYFGVGYAPGNDGSSLDNIVEFSLAPATLYGSTDIGDCHTYAAGWYGGAAAGADGTQGPIGLTCPPAPTDYSATQSLNQNWTPGVSQSQQWALQPGAMPANYTYTAAPLQATEYSVTGSAGFQSDANGYLTQITFQSRQGDGEFSSCLSTFDPPLDSNQYGMSFTLQWDAAQIGDYLIVNIGGDIFYTCMVLDGQSLQRNGTSVSTLTNVAISCDPDVAIDADLSIYFYSAVGNSGSAVTLSNFQGITVDYADGGLLRKRREMRSALSTEKRAKKTA